MIERHTELVVMSPEAPSTQTFLILKDPDRAEVSVKGFAEWPSKRICLVVFSRLDRGYGFGGGRPWR